MVNENSFETERISVIEGSRQVLGKVMLFQLREPIHPHPSFFISKKVQVETPELEPGGNACNFIKILKYGKLEIGLRRDLRDFSTF